MFEPEEMNGEALAKPTEASALTAQPLLEWMLSQVFGERGADEDVQDGTGRPLSSLPLVS
jgi:GH15 family glucan-1,4-alpha-glucosidase